MKKRLLCTLLSLLLILAMMPATVCAIDDDDDNSNFDLQNTIEEKRTFEAENVEADEGTALAADVAEKDPSSDSHVAIEQLKLAVNPFNNGKDQYKIYWQKVSGKYYLFLPADCNRSEMTVYFEGDASVTVDANKITSGEKTDAFADGQKFTVKCGDEECSLTVMQSSTIPSMYITTEAGEMDKVNKDKSYKTKGYTSIITDGEVALDNTKLKSIKGRGNSTWMNPKKPYNIKFDDKTSVLGMPEAKKWALLACYYDLGMLHNPIAWEIAENMGLTFNSEYRFVDLYINNEYNGAYIVCENVEVGNDRVNIFDLTKATEEANEKTDLETFEPNNEGNHGTPSKNWVDIPNNPEDITGGYLLECDYRSRQIEEVSGFVTTRGQAVTVKEPEYASKEQVEYISEYWQDAEDAIVSPNGHNSKGKHYSYYFNVDSLVNMYLFLELSGNMDAGLSSTYFYKDKAGKLVAGPIWDNDLSFGYCMIRGESFNNDPTIWWAGNLCYDEMVPGLDNVKSPTVYNWLYRRADFRSLAAKRWNELRRELSYQSILEQINANTDVVRDAALMNGIRWSQLSGNAQFDHTINVTKNYIKSRIKYLDKGFGRRAVHVFYDANGGSGWVNELSILTKGDKILIRDAKNTNISNILGILDARSIEEAIEILKGSLKAPKKGLKFQGWNTKKDGTGETYQPGDIVRVRNTVTLYAQWGNTTAEISKENKKRLALYDSSLAKTVKSLLNIIKAGAI